MSTPLKFDRVKAIVKENASLIVHPAYRTGRLTLLAMGRFLDGTTPCTTRETGNLLCELISEHIDAADVRCINEIVSLVPQGYDKRLPSWLYGPVDAQLEDDGWTLYPAGKETYDPCNRTES